ncbi:cytochrome P450 [Dendrothele bispora CBS 962.96]|uniref:Cytochrome P450 n=1 Tax=Dendrothele bispora (strain CBS 962.96) TaxID=1314807 RepID=A0A4S8L4U8_DENBC|nr:cytochrome P450 [Dendrothele bispora CBS 962.96]THU88035.1 cytochrome P450 [Dendrothele bispora CBS 962.96]
MEVFTPTSMASDLLSASKSQVMTLAALIFTALVLFRRLAKNPNNPQGLPPPPGPRGLPILGNLLQIPSDRYWLKFDEWIREYGPVVSINLAGKRVVLLGTPKVAADLFDRKSAIYSDRPRWILANDILAKGMHIGVMPYGEKHRRFRKAIHSGLGTKALASYHPIEEHEARIYLKEVSKNPADFRNSVKRYTGAVIMATMYGHTVTTFDSDKYVKKIFASAARFAGSLAPGEFLVDVFPWLRYVPSWVPGAGWKKKAAEWAEDDYDLFTTMREAARVNAAKQSSFISEGLGNAYGVDDVELAYIGGIISQTPDTLMSVSSGFMLAMVRWPEIQKRAQEEIDRVVGRKRFPVFADSVNLPYVTAIVKETCRWRPVAPLSVPHASTEDDVYMGYFIPKGTTVISSIWSIHRDPETYPNPDEFKPERFLDENMNEVNTKESRSFGHHLYGFGRRLCPGATMADHAVWVFAAHILWALNLEREKDEFGREIIPDVRPEMFSSGGEASHPLPFKCKITVRPGVQEFLDEIELPQPSPEA